MPNKGTFQKDLYRYFGQQGPALLQRFFPAYEIRYIKAFRRCQKHPKSFLCHLRLRSISKRTQIQIPPCVLIGGGFQILHLGRVVVNHHVKIGRNCTINPGVLIGQEERGQKRGSPTIGDRVWIGTNAVIVGKIHIGNDVLIAPNAYVNFDVPDHSVVLGNPGRIIENKHATLGYIKNPVE